VAGARVDSPLGVLTTDGSGQFTLTQSVAPTSPMRVSVNADGHRPRETSIGFPRSTDLVIDLVSRSAPFDEVFYNQLARDAFDEPGRNHQLWRWTVAPKYYLKTTTERGQPVPPEVLQVVRRGVVDGTHYFTGGRFAATIEEGVDARPQQTGWINVLIVHDIPPDDICGRASSVGGNPSTIQLRLERCGCGSNKVPADLVLHEVGHALGMFHVADRDSVMVSGVTKCNQLLPSPMEQYHAALIYARPRGNRDPDIDPAAFTLSERAGAPGRP
jgi:hypothetical protein